MVSVRVRAKFPRLFAEVFRNRMNHSTFNGHLAVEVVILMQPTKALNRNAVQGYAILSRVDAPALNIT